MSSITSFLRQFESRQEFRALKASYSRSVVFRLVAGTKFVQEEIQTLFYTSELLIFFIKLIASLMCTEILLMKVALVI